jgi:hypothetical protein
LWENRYKKIYALIYNEFVAQVYFIIFKRECSRLLTMAKKMISKVGHWYLEETSTYIRVFGATGTCIYSLLMSQIGSSWEKYVTKPSYRATIPLWLKTRSDRSYPMVSM